MRVKVVFPEPDVPGRGADPQECPKAGRPAPRNGPINEAQVLGGHFERSNGRYVGVSCRKPVVTDYPLWRVGKPACYNAESGMAT